MKLKFTLPLVAALSAACSPEQSEPNTETANAPEERISSPFNPKLSSSTKYIDLDGEYLVLNDTAAEVAFSKHMAGFGEQIAQTDRSLRRNWPKGLSLDEVLTQSKIHEIRSVSSSSKKINDGWINKSFYDLNGCQSGIFSCLKGRGGKWAGLDFAPAEADFIFETDLNISNIHQLVKDLLVEVDQKDRDRILQALTQMSSQDPMTKSIMDGAHVRALMVTQLDREHTLDFSRKGVKLANMNSLLRVEGGVKFWNIFVKGHANHFKVEKKGGLEFYRMEAIEAPRKQGNIPDLTPCVVVDKANDLIYITARESYYHACVAGESKLSDEPSVQELMSSLSDSGSSMTYISHDLLSYIDELYRGEGGNRARIELIDDSRRKDRPMLRYLFKAIDKSVLPALVKSKSGYATTVSLNEEGLLVASKTPIATKGASLSLALVGLPPMTLAAYPVIKKQIAKSRATQAISNSKDIYISLREYNINTKKNLPGTPGDGKSANEHFREVFKQGCIYDEKPFYVKGISWAKEGDGDISSDENVLERGSNVYGYFPGADLMKDAANRPLLITPLIEKNGEIVVDVDAFGGQVVLLRIDGSAAAYEVTPDGKRIIGQPELFKNGTVYYMNMDGKRLGVKVAMPDM